jgi:ABC-type multidrug transport system permease subunit
MTGLMRLTLTELTLLRRDGVAALATVAIPLFVLLSFGLSYGTRDTALPAVAVAIALALNALYSVPSALGSAREQGLLRRLATTPVHPAALLSAQLLVHLLLTVLTLALLVVAALALGITLPRHAPGALAALALGVGALFACGVLIAAVAPSGRAATGLGVLLYFPLSFLGGVTIPRDQLPPLLARVGDLTPLGAFRQAVQDSWAGAPPQPLQLAVLALYTLVLGAAAVALFRWESSTQP